MPTCIGYLKVTVTKMRGFRKQKPNDGVDIKTCVTAKLKEIEDLKQHVQSCECPACKTKKLRVVAMELAKGWELAVFCDTCKSKGVLTREGFHFDVTVLQGDKKQ